MAMWRSSRSKTAAFLPEAVPLKFDPDWWQWSRNPDPPEALMVK